LLRHSDFYFQIISITGLVPWLSGTTLVFDRRAFAVLRSTYSWRV